MTLRPSPRKIASFPPPQRVPMDAGLSEMHPRTIVALGSGLSDQAYAAQHSVATKVKAGKRPA